MTRLRRVFLVAAGAILVAIGEPEVVRAGDRIKLTIGMAASIGGESWGDVLRDADYDATLVDGGGFFFPSRTIDYPTRDFSTSELFYGDLSVRWTRRVGFGLTHNRNEPFDGWTGVKAVVASDESTSYRTLHADLASIATWSPQIFVRAGGRVSASIGVGPSWHATEFMYTSVNDAASVTGRRTRSDVKWGFTVRASVDAVLQDLCVGICGQYNHVGSETLDGDDVGDPDFPASEFDLHYAFVGVHVGIAR